MLINCLAACAHLTITVSEIERDIGRKSSFFSYPLAFDAPVRGGGSRRNIGIPFGMQKLEWLGYQMVKKFRRYVYSFCHDPRTWQTDRRTDGRTPGDSIYRAYAYTSRGNKWSYSKSTVQNAHTEMQSQHATELNNNIPHYRVAFACHRNKKLSCRKEVALCPLSPRSLLSDSVTKGHSTH